VPSNPTTYLLVSNNQLAGNAETREEAVDKARVQTINADEYVNVYERVATVKPVRTSEVMWADENMGDC